MIEYQNQPYEFYEIDKRKLFVKLKNKKFDGIIREMVLDNIFNDVIKPEIKEIREDLMLLIFNKEIGKKMNFKKKKILISFFFFKDFDKLNKHVKSMSKSRCSIHVVALTKNNNENYNRFYFHKPTTYFDALLKNVQFETKKFLIETRSGKFIFC